MEVDLREISHRIADMISEVTSCVVTVYTTVPEISLFFGPRVLHGAGSGFIVREGLLVTNAHVVAKAREINLVFIDGSSSRGRLLAADPMRDLALIEADTSSFPAARLGDSDSLRVGEVVFAVGSPLGMTGTSVSMGLVSSLGRAIMDEQVGVYLDDLIQTDAAINPGNSGGPIVNCSGEAVGVATAIIPFAQGIGFAIPINSVKRFLKSIERYGRPLRVWIGVFVAPINPNIAKMYEIPYKEGLIVIHVVPKSPAAGKGMRPGDVILEAGGRRMVRASDLRNALEDLYGSDCVDLKIYRDGRILEICVPTVAEAL